MWCRIFLNLNLKRTFTTSLVLRKTPDEFNYLWPEEVALPFFAQYNLDESDLKAKIRRLRASWLSVRHELEILEEAGFSLTTRNMIKFRTLWSTDIQELVAKGYLHDHNVDFNFVKFLEPFPYRRDLPMPTMTAVAEHYKPIKQYCRKFVMESQHAIDLDWPRDLPLEMEHNLKSEQRRVMRQYYVWRLNSNLSTIDRHLFTYSKITGIRSIRSLKETIDILENDLELPKQLIVRNFFLLSVTPERLQNLMKKTPMIGRSKLKEAARNVPKILAKSVDHIVQIDSALKEYSILDNITHARHTVFTFTPKTIRKRLEAIATSELRIYLDHPRICELIYYFSKAWDRFHILKSKGYKCITLNLLTSSEAAFNNYLSEGVDRAHVTVDLYAYLSHSFGVEKSKMIPIMEKHPMRYFVPLTEVRSTLEFLLQCGFSKELIIETLTLVLYPKEKVAEALKWVSDSSDLADLGMPGGVIADSNNMPSSFPSGTKFPDKRLALCLYYLEKPFHFTGDGAVPANSTFPSSIPSIDAAL